MLFIKFEFYLMDINNINNNIFIIEILKLHLKRLILITFFIYQKY